MKPVFLAAVLLASSTLSAEEKLPPVHIVPNFHPASCGWLTNWSSERNYCANSYLAHLDRVRDDAKYKFVLSECNNMIAIANFAPERFEELKRRVKEGRVELVNGFFLEPTVSLSGGEALARMGIEGRRWQQEVMGVTPRFCWAIDICGAHEQLPQITAKLGLDALVYARSNPSDKAIFRSESPDGTRIPTLVTGQYSDWSKDGVSMVFGEKKPLTTQQLGDLKNYFAKKAPSTPAGAPILVLGGKGDYSLPPARKENPSELLSLWNAFAPDVPLRFSTLGEYYDTLDLDKLDLPTVRSGTDYSWNAFWVQCPRVKAWYRRDEHLLQAAEIAATVASLKSDFSYPVQDLYHAWLLMLLNMDRNTLWGAAGGMVFEHETSWDVKDRFEWVESNASRITSEAVRKLTGNGSKNVLFNPLNWDRNDPVNGEFQVSLPSVGIGATGVPEETAAIPLPATIETKFYTAQVDPSTGALVSLKVAGCEVLGGPANVLVAEKSVRKHNGQPGDELVVRPERPRLSTSGDSPSTIKVTENAVAMTVEADGTLIGGAPCKRLIRFNKNYQRIDFVTELNDLPDETVVVAEFPLAEPPTEIRRGIPFGFSHGAWAKPNPDLTGKTKGIFPAIRWSDYALPGGGGVALLDRGLPGREINDKTPVIYLFNAVEKYYGYPNAWLSGKGSHRLEYAIVPYAAGWNDARIPQMAWEYNCPPILVSGCADDRPQSFLKTSDNVIVEAMSRDGADIELRLVECLGLPGTAKVKLDLPHGEVSLTDLIGKNAHPLDGGPEYSFPVKPQEIVTMRFRTATPVESVKPLIDWSPLVPEHKRAALNTYQKDVVGHPPRGK